MANYRTLRRAAEARQTLTLTSALGAEIRYNAGADPNEEAESDHYWTLVEQLIFKRKLYSRAADN